MDNNVNELLSQLDHTFPHVANQIRSTWGIPSCEEYIGDIVLDKRCNRRGFPVETWEILTKLYILHPTFKSERIQWF
jgi:hypothetical protein